MVIIEVANRVQIYIICYSVGFIRITIEQEI